MRRTKFWQLVPALAVVTLLFASQGIGSVSAARPATSLPKVIKIGQITSLTGAYAAYGAMEVDGFKAGLAYATHGTNKVDGSSFQIIQFDDNNTSTSLPDPTIASQDAKTALESDHVNLIQCCASSDSATAVASLMPKYKKILMVAPATDDTLSGINKYTFRTSREAMQDAMTGAAYAHKKFGDRYMTLAQDYSFGHEEVSDWKSQSPKGTHDLGDEFFSLSATDFTPQIQAIENDKPKYVFVACAGLQCLSLFSQMKSDGIFEQSKVFTGLPNVAAIPYFANVATEVGWISDYYYTFPNNKANTFMKSYMEKNYSRPADIFDQDSFAAAQQIVAAIKKTKSLNTNALIKALDGQTVNGPKGKYTIRAKDHVCIQPMYITNVVQHGSNLVPELVKTVTPIPPVQMMH